MIKGGKAGIKFQFRVEPGKNVFKTPLLEDIKLSNTISCV